MHTMWQWNSWPRKKHNPFKERNGEMKWYDKTKFKKINKKNPIFSSVIITIKR